MDTLESKEHLKMRVEKATRQRLRGKSETEIQKELAKVFETLKTGPRTFEEYNSAEYAIKSYWEFVESKRVDAVLQERKDEQKRAADKIKNGVERMWKGSASTDESEQAWKTAEQFMELYPAVRPNDTATGAAFKKYMRVNNLDPRELSSWEAALQALAATNQPEIFLSPKAAGIGPEEELGGYSLRSYPNLHLLLRPAPTAEQLERLKAAKMSADEYKNSRPELRDGLPFVIQQQFFKAAHSLASFEREYIFNDENNGKLLAELNRTQGQFNLSGLRAAFHELKKRGELELKPIAAHGQITTLTEHEPRETGEPEAPGKLRAKVARMSSSEMATFLRENPSARRAIDGV